MACYTFLSQTENRITAFILYMYIKYNSEKCIFLDNNSR